MRLKTQLNILFTWVPQEDFASQKLFSTQILLLQEKVSICSYEFST